jgi:autotransporter-associated beta strand protein
LVKTGPGTLVITNAASFAGNVRVLQGMLRSIGALGSGTVTVSNGVFAAYGAGTTLLNTFTVAGSTLLADAGGSLGAGSIALLSGSTLAATNAGSLGSGSLVLTNATLRMDAGGTAGTRAITMVSGGLIQVYDGAGFNNATLSLGGGTINFCATTTMNCALPLTATTTCSATTPAVGTLAGAVTASGYKKLIVSGSGRLQMAGGGTFSGTGEIFVQGSGDLTIVSNEVVVTGYAGLESGGKRFAIADGGTFSMTGSSVNLHAGMGAGDCTFEVLTGGVYNVSSGVNLLFGNGGNTTLRIRGGTVNVANGGQFLLGNLSTTATGTVELAAGGLLKTSRQIKTGLGSGAFLFTGGTLQSDGVNTYDPWVATNIAVSVGRAGGMIDTRGLEMELGSAGLAGAGTLSLLGGGSLLFAQPSTNWAGGLSLVQGTAVVSTNRALGFSAVSLGTNTLRVAANAFLPNAVGAAVSGGAVFVDAGATGLIASVSGGLLVKRGSGGLLMDDAAEGTDFSIQGGQLIATPIDGMTHAPAGNPAIWVDATVAASFVTANSNDVSRWYDRRSPGDATGFYATNLYNRPIIASNRVGGLPTLDFGVLGQSESGGSGDNRMMGFKNYQTNIRTVFWIIGSKNGGGFLLGDSQVIGSARFFHRGSASGTYGGVASDAIWGGVGQEKGVVRNGETWTNGVSVNGASTGLSGNYDLVTWRLAAADDATNGMAGAVWFASCYASSGGRLNGGQELGEVLIYTNRLTDAEIKTTERYLSRKWFPTRIGSWLSLRTVSLDGAGAGFVNAYTGPVQVATLNVNATNVFVSGAAGGTAVSQTVVTASGVLGPSVARALSVGHLTLQDSATLEAAFSASGTVYTVAVGGNLMLPSEAGFVVTGTATPPTTALLVQASNSVSYVSDNTVWSNAGNVSRGSSVLVDTDAKKVWLKTPRGTQILLR